jgi:cytochrome c
MMRAIALLAPLLLVASCSEKAPEVTEPPENAAVSDTGMEPKVPAVGAAALSPAQAASIIATLGPAYAGADLANGKKVFARCGSCHTLPEGGESMTGPNLWGVLGSKAASREGFAYSASLRETGATWTPQILDRWIANPKAMAPGTKMIFAGVDSATDRRDVIAFIATRTQTPPAEESAD